jgi:ribosomal-protein-serine acetyltransferase
VRLTPGVPVDAEVSLAPRDPSDAAEIFAIVERHRGDLREWLTWVDSTRSAADVRRYAQYAQAQYERHSAFDYAIRANGRVVGAIGLHSLDWDNRSAQMGYWISPDVRGRGVAARAGAALTAYAFQKLDLHRIEIRCVVDNVRSRAVAQRLGYAFEGTLTGAYRLHGTYRDIALYGRTARP